MLTDILLYTGLFLGGVIAGLKIIAPRTKTKVDDTVLSYGEQAKKLLEALGIKVPGDVEVTAVAAKKV